MTSLGQVRVWHDQAGWGSGRLLVPSSRGMAVRPNAGPHQHEVSGPSSASSSLLTLTFDEDDERS